MPEDCGLCSGDIPGIAAYVNEAQQNLIMAAGAQGWWWGWGKVTFNVSVASPYITLPREFARLIGLDICCHPIRIQNEFYEFLPGGICKQDTLCNTWKAGMAGYDRGMYPTMVDLTDDGQQYLRVCITDQRDVGKRILIKGLDQYGQHIYSTDAGNEVEGFYLEFEWPCVTSSFTVTKIEHVIKDQTYGDVILKQVKNLPSSTGILSEDGFEILGEGGGVILPEGGDETEVTLSRYAPDEYNPAYRRYYISKYPCGQCCVVNGQFQVNGLAKVECRPVYRDTDWLVIGNMPALIEECIAIYLSRSHDANSQAMAELHHRKAIKRLRDEMRHYNGDQNPAVEVDIWNGQEPVLNLV
jgi:hypothetical protein